MLNVIQLIVVNVKDRFMSGSCQVEVRLIGGIHFYSWDQALFTEALTGVSTVLLSTTPYRESRCIAEARSSGRNEASTS